MAPVVLVLRQLYAGNPGGDEGRADASRGSDSVGASRAARRSRTPPRAPSFRRTFGASSWFHRACADNAVVELVVAALEPRDLGSAVHHPEYDTHLDRRGHHAKRQRRTQRRPASLAFIHSQSGSLARAGARWSRSLAASAAACTEATSPPRRFPVLDDLGTSDWQSVSVGGDHTLRAQADRQRLLLGEQSVLPARAGELRHGLRSAGQPLRMHAASRNSCPRPGVKFTSVSAGARHTCAITSSRDAYCWGANDAGQIGGFSPTGPTLVRIQGSLGWTQISAGYSHTCAVRTDGVLYCWGANDRGQLGNGSFSANDGLIRVPISAPVASVSAGQQRTCARTTLGTVYCWGAIWQSRSNGLELSNVQTSPKTVPDAPAMAWLSVGTFTTCGADVSGFGYCWEANPRGQMGTGTQDGSTESAPRRLESRVHSDERRHRADVRRRDERRRVLLGRRHVRPARYAAITSRRAVRLADYFRVPRDRLRYMDGSSSRRSAPDSEATRAASRFAATSTVGDSASPASAATERSDTRSRFRCRYENRRSKR